MPNNKHDAVRSTEGVVSIGPFQAGITTRIDVPPNHSAVVFVNHQYRETLPAGRPFTLEIALLGRVEYWLVDTSIRTMVVRIDDLPLKYVSDAGRMSVRVSLDLAVKYEITNPRQLLKHRSPIAAYYDEILHAINTVTSRMDHAAFETADLSSAVLAQLKRRDLPTSIGITTSDVIAPEKRGSDVVSKIEEGIVLAQLHRLEQIHDAAMRNQIAQATRLTQEFVFQYYPQYYPMLFGDVTRQEENAVMVMTELLRAGTDPAQIGDTLRSIAGALVTGPRPSYGSVLPTRPQLPSRVAADIRDMGHQWPEFTLMQDADSQYWHGIISNRIGDQYQVFLEYGSDYPNVAPQLAVARNGSPYPIYSNYITYWNPAYSPAAIVGEVIQQLT